MVFAFIYLKIVKACYHFLYLKRHRPKTGIKVWTYHLGVYFEVFLICIGVRVPCFHVWDIPKIPYKPVKIAQITWVVFINFDKPKNCMFVRSKLCN